MDSRRTGGESAYTLYRRGMELIADGDFDAAAEPLDRVARLEPDKTSVREALGRALFRSRRYGEAAREFEAVVERYPVNDFAQFCLGRALTLCGERRRGRHHLAIAARLRPERRDYRHFLERASSTA